MKFRVLLESTKRLAEEVVVDDPSVATHEQAVAHVLALGPRVVEVRAELRPTWVDTDERVEQTEQFEHEILGTCFDCQQPIVNRSIPGWPWTYASVPEDEGEGNLCFPCASKRGIK